MTDQGPLRAFMLDRIRAIAKLNPADVTAEAPLYRFGIDSRTLMMVIEEAESRFGLEADIERISPAESIEGLLTTLGPRRGDGH